MIKINDIKPIVEIPDFSIYLYYAFILLAILMLLLCVYFLYRFLKPKKVTQEMIWYKTLSNLDLEDTKGTAYAISKYGRYLAKEERQLRLIEELVDELSFYKYKKEISSEFNQNIKIKFNIFMESIDV